MQKLRSTFKRSRTPTGAEMKSQSSLEVPKQVRSASFDEIQLHDNNSSQELSSSRDLRSSASSASSSHSPGGELLSPRGRRHSTLRVPQCAQRSRSFDVSERSIYLLPPAPSSPPAPKKETVVVVPKVATTTTTTTSTAASAALFSCWHCHCLEEYNKMHLSRDESSDSELLLSRPDDYDDDDDDDENSECESLDSAKRDGSPEIRVTLMDSENKSTDDDEITTTTTTTKEVKLLTEQAAGGGGQRRRSICSPLVRQEALTSFPLFEFPSVATSGSNDDDEDDEQQQQSEEQRRESERNRLVVRDIFLTVPDIKRDRAASVDSCFKSNKPDCEDALAVPQQSIRSKSVDIVLPTEVQSRYTALQAAGDSRYVTG